NPTSPPPVRRWASRQTANKLPTSNGRYAHAYHQLLVQPDIQQRFRKRKTSVEPFFDLVAKVIGTTSRQKELPIQKLVNVRMVMALATLSVQIAMTLNSIFGLPLREIASIKAAFS
ncbi:MAG: hypothetical protein KC423_25455, partial [Anaerolineales bacterium]|nr:hypothetical protein [Anaerolineales bacterium]